MAYCKNCGTKLASNARFCPICGRPTDNLYKHYKGEEESHSYSSVYKVVGITAIVILTLLGIAGLSYEGNHQEGESYSFFSVGLTIDDIKSIKTTYRRDSILSTLIVII